MQGLLVGLLLLPVVAVAGHVLDATVTHDDGYYRLAVTARIDAPPELVFRAITDYANLAALNPSIKESQVLATEDPQTHHVRSVIRVCILVFCKHVVQVQRVVQLDNRTIEAVMLPQGSDFRSGIARWQLAADGTATEMSFTETFEPDFWVPPIIGPWLIRRELVREATRTTTHIERLDRPRRHAE